MEGWIMCYVLIKDNFVVQKQPNDQEGFIKAPSDVICGYVYNNGSFYPPNIILNKKKILDKIRSEKAEGGIQVNGFTIDTDARAVAYLLGIRESANTDPNFTVDWDVGDFNFISLNSQQIIFISNAVRDHIQKCYKASKLVANNLSNLNTEESIKTEFDNSYLSL